MSFETKTANKVGSNSPTNSSRMGMNHAAFVACKLGRNLKEKRRKENDSYREEDEVLRKSNEAARFNRMRITYGVHRPLFIELLRTETAYVDSLHFLISRIMLPLQVALEIGPEGIISREDIGVIFSNVAQLFEVNMELLRIIEANLGMDNVSGQEAEERDDNDLASAFADAFTNMLPVFKAFYSVYANNYIESIKRTEECRIHNPLFRRFIDTCSHFEGSHGLDITGFLIKPVQRVCKYPLFFRELLQCTDESHPMYSKLMAASDAVFKIVERVNSKGRETQDSLQIFHIAARLEGLDKSDPTKQLIIPGRRFISSFVCKVHYRSQVSGSKPAKEALYGENNKNRRECFLFNDILLVCKPVGEKLDFRLWLELRHVLVSIPPFQTFPNLSRSSIESVVRTDTIDTDVDKDNAVIYQYAFDVVRIRNGENGGAGVPKTRSVASRRRTANLGSSSKGSLVEKYSLWFKCKQERDSLCQTIETIQDDLEKHTGKVVSTRMAEFSPRLKTLGSDKTPSESNIHTSTERNGTSSSVEE